jgi:uncharacterized protein (UPF0332 family)
MNLNDCLLKGHIKQDPLAHERIPKSLEISQRFLTSAKKNLDIQECEMSELASYNAIFHAARSLLFKKGYIERSHVCVIVALNELYQQDHELTELLNTFDKIRITRHNIQYGGNLVQKTEAIFVLEFAQRFLEKTKTMLKTR